MPTAVTDLPVVPCRALRISSVHAVSCGGDRATGSGMRRASVMKAVGLLCVAAFLWLGFPGDNFEGTECDSVREEQVKAIELKPGQVRLYVKRSPWMTDKWTIGVFKLEPGGKSAIYVPVHFGSIMRDDIEVKAGLKAGDLIIADDMSRFDVCDRIKLGGCR